MSVENRHFQTCKCQKFITCNWKNPRKEEALKIRFLKWTKWVPGNCCYLENTVIWEIW